MKILVRAPNWIGDQVLAFPFFYGLRALYPRAKITSVCVPWVRDLQFKGLVDEVRVLPRSGKPGFWARFSEGDQFAKQLSKDGPWDLGVSLPNSFSSAWLMWRAGARVRRGYATEGRSLLLNQSVRWPETGVEHRSEAYTRLLPSFPFDWSTRDFWGVLPENELDDGIPGVLPRFDPRTHWPEVPQVESPAQPYWILAPGATAESRRWDLDRFIQLGELIHAQTGWMGVIVGGAKETPLAASIQARSRTEWLDRTAQGPVSGLAQLFAGAKLTVCNESGLAHVASLCGSPVQIICGAADPRRTRPMGPGPVEVTTNPVDCWPCERNSCPLPTAQALKCLRGIEAERVWKEIQDGFGIGKP